MQLRPGVTCDQAIKAVTELVDGGLNDLANRVPRIGFQEDAAAASQRQYGETLSAAVTAYDLWTGNAARYLNTLFLDRWVSNRMRDGRYPFLVGSSEESFTKMRMLHVELSELRSFLSIEVANELREMKDRFKRHQGRTLVLDSNDLLHYQRFDKIPWTKVYGKGVVVVIPHVIVDEMDAKAYSSASEKIRKRAQGVYRLLEQLQNDIDADGFAQMTGDATLEILADEPGHRRLPNNDNEVVARAAYLQQALAPGQVTMITRDIGLRARARTWKLKAEALPEKFLIPADHLSSKELDEAVSSITVDLPDEDDESAQE